MFKGHTGHNGIETGLSATEKKRVKKSETEYGKKETACSDLFDVIYLNILKGTGYRDT